MKTAPWILAAVAAAVWCVAARADVFPKETLIKGERMIVRKGESHGIANTGKQPLVFIDVIAEQ